MAPRTKNRKKNKRDKERELLEAYGDPTKPGSLGGASRFARIHRLKPAEAQRFSKKIWLTRSIDRDDAEDFPPYPYWCLVKTSNWLQI